MENKTVLEWLALLPTPELRLRATTLAEPSKRMQLVNNIQKALMTAFVWCHSPEGHDYWNNIYDTIGLMENYEPSMPSVRPADPCMPCACTRGYITETHLCEERGFWQNSNDYCVVSDKFNEDCSY